MPKPSVENVRKLEDLPNVGKATAGDLRLIGIDYPSGLVGQDPFHMYESLCRITGQRHDPCVMDVFMSIVHFMEKGESKPWWHFTEQRKRICQKC